MPDDLPVSMADSAEWKAELAAEFRYVKRDVEELREERKEVAARLIEVEKGLDRIKTRMTVIASALGVAAAVGATIAIDILKGLAQ